MNDRNTEAEDGDALRCEAPNKRLVMLRFLFNLLIPDSILNQTYNEVMHRTKLPRDSVGVSARMYRIFGMKLGDLFSEALKPLFDKHSNDSRKM